MISFATTFGSAGLLMWNLFLFVCQWWILQNEAAVEVSQWGTREEKLQAERLQESDWWETYQASFGLSLSVRNKWHFKKKSLSSLCSQWTHLQPMGGCWDWKWNNFPKGILWGRAHHTAFTLGSLFWISGFFQRKMSTGRTEQTASTRASTTRVWSCCTTSWWPTACLTSTWVRHDQRLLS